MWNIRQYAAIAAVGTGLAVAAASPASAQCGGWGGYGGWGGGYGAAGWGGGGYGGGWGGGWGCRHRHAHGYGGYALAYAPRHSGYAYAAYTSRHNRLTYARSRHHQQLYASAHSVRYSLNHHQAKRHLIASLKQSTRKG